MEGCFFFYNVENIFAKKLIFVTDCEVEMLKEIKKIDKMSHNKKIKIDMKKEERTKLMSFFTSNLSGRVRNFELPATKALMLYTNQLLILSMPLMNGNKKKIL